MTQNKNKPTVSEYDPQAGSKKKSNIAARLCALLLAIVLWFYVMRVDSPTHERTLDYIPIQLDGAQELLESSGLSVISGYDGMVSVTLSGRQSDLSRLKMEDIEAEVDLSSITLPGEHHLPVSFTLPGGIKVTGYEPTTLEVYVDSTLQKDVEVQPLVTYTKEENLVLGEYTTDPALVKISGPATIIDTVDHASCEVNVGNITKSMSATGTIKLYDRSGNVISNPYIKTNVSSVAVHVPVYKQKYLTPVVRFTDGVIPERYIQTVFSRNLLTVQGESEYIDALGDTLEVAAVDARQIKDSYSMEVLLKSVDDNLDYLDGDTVTIEMNLDQSVRANRRSIPINLSEARWDIRGTSGGASYSIQAPEVLYIEARSVNKISIDALTADGITLRADLSTITESGDYRRDVVVEFDDPTIYTSEKYTVTFSVTFS